MALGIVTASTACAFLLAATAVQAAHPHGRRLQIRNEGAQAVAIEWINPLTGEIVPFGGSQQGEVLSFESYVNHTFRFRSIRHKEEEETEVQYLTVGQEDEEQIFVLKQDLEVERLHTSSLRPRDEETRAMTEKCRQRAKKRLAANQDLEEVSRDLIQCMQDEAARLFIIQNEELSFQRQLRRDVANLGENYTCADSTKETSEPKQVTSWTYEDHNRTVGILHSRPDSQIHILQDFITPDECTAIQEAAAATLHRGTVADGKGGSKLSENRKAWQAGLSVKNWQSTTDPIASVKRRIFAYANHATGYNMTIPGQEDIMSIQYFGEGVDNPAPDRYMPHCDGDCDLLPHKRGGRVATMVIYCDVPELGGATNFQNANVFVKPLKGAAAFFSYMDPVTTRHEEGFTTHSGCPVLEGTKRIAVQWMRIGVDEANPWDSFDTNTISLKNK